MAAKKVHGDMARNVALEADPFFVAGWPAAFPRLMASSGRRPSVLARALSVGLVRRCPVWVSSRPFCRLSRASAGYSIGAAPAWARPRLVKAQRGTTPAFKTHVNSLPPFHQQFNPSR